ncbi:MAG: sigma-70 family RNA polymerase sigma factor [Chloroflexi bacterium]|nr:sigma-70 family RNA polymerase sigma factor [Chloroflexota bacterium]
MSPADQGAKPDARPDARPDAEWLAARFEDHRGHLRAVAYRMLGSLAEAEDTVQDAWLRVARADASSVENLGGWLTTIVARLALDRLRSRTSRREDPMGVHVPDPVVAALDDRHAEAAAAADPARQAELADAVGLALLVVLETLSPAERLAFVLHDTFGLPFDEIAPIVERSPVATRQLASRARRRLQGSAAAAAGHRPVPARRQRELLDAFLAAARGDDFEALLRILDPGVVVRADTGPGLGPLGRSREIRGATAVARQAMAFRNLAPGARLVRVNGALGFVVLSGGRPYAVLGFTYRDGAIAEIDILADPERLASLDLPSR